MTSWREIIPNMPSSTPAEAIAMLGMVSVQLQTQWVPPEL